MAGRRLLDVLLPGVLTALLDLVLPAACAGCDEPGERVLCPPCREGLTAGPAVRGLEGPPPLRVGLAGPYLGAAPGAVVAHKEHGRLALGPPLGSALAVAVLALEPPDLPLVLVPAPSAPRAVRARGVDHARRLARAAASALCEVGVPARAAPVLRQVRRVRDQAGLGVEERARNLAGALRCTGTPAGPQERVVVVDDVLTTGATLLEAARAVRASGAVLLGGAAVAGA